MRHPSLEAVEGVQNGVCVWGGGGRGRGRPLVNLQIDVLCFIHPLCLRWLTTVFPRLN